MVERHADWVRFEARKVGFIQFPVLVAAITYRVASGEEVEVDRDATLCRRSPPCSLLEADSEERKGPASSVSWCHP